MEKEQFPREKYEMVERKDYANNSLEYFKLLKVENL